MSAMGHEQTSLHIHVMSVSPLKADIHQRGLHVRLVPTTEVARCHARGISVVTEVLKTLSMRKVSHLPVGPGPSLWERSEHAKLLHD